MSQRRVGWGCSKRSERSCGAPPRRAGRRRARLPRSAGCSRRRGTPPRWPPARWPDTPSSPFSPAMRARSFRRSLMARMPLVGTEDHRERSVDQGACVHRAQRRLERGLRRRHAVDGVPARSRHDMRRHLLGKPVPSTQQVEQVGDDLGVGLKPARVTELLHVTAVGVIARYFAVMNDRPVQKREGVRTSPTSRACWWENARAPSTPRRDTRQVGRKRRCPRG